MKSPSMTCKYKTSDLTNFMYREESKITEEEQELANYKATNELIKKMMEEE